jgi:polyferredoxin
MDSANMLTAMSSITTLADLYSNKENWNAEKGKVEPEPRTNAALWLVFLLLVISIVIIVVGSLYAAHVLV